MGRRGRGGVVALTRDGGLDRFVLAQVGVYARALSELEQGRKTGHWMWFVFPQLAGLGRSAMSRQYAIADLNEARAYLEHPVLGPRLIECAQVVLAWSPRRSAVEILGEIDAAKLRSSATLFEHAGGDAVFGGLLEDLFRGIRDPETLEGLG